MKVRYIIYGLILVTTFFSSCVGEDVFVVEELNNSVSFERALHSVAEDEEIPLNLIFRDSDRNIVNDQSDFVIEYSSDNPEILTIDDQGIIMITQSQNVEGVASKNLAIGSVVTVRVNASIGDFIFDEISDEIIIGKVTITEAEAQLLDPEDVREIVEEGYTPKITITNPVSEIDIDNAQDVQLNGIYQNLKNEIEEVNFTWSSSDTSVLEVSNEGVLSPTAEGNAIITVAFDDIASSDIEIIVSQETIEVVEPEETPEPVDTKEVIGFGILQSNSSYEVEGNFQIIKEGDVVTITLDDTYATGRLPDLVIYLSNQTSTNNGASIISEDITASGEQSFVIPDSINPDDYINVLLFCRDFGQRVGFGIINR